MRGLAAGLGMASNPECGLWTLALLDLMLETPFDGESCVGLHAAPTFEPSCLQHYAESTMKVLCLSGNESADKAGLSLLTSPQLLQACQGCRSRIVMPDSSPWAVRFQVDPTPAPEQVL